jgi:hypothetical protein
MKGLRMKRRLFLWAVLLIVGMVPGLAAGEIYQWIDEEGVQHFTDGPPPPGARIVEGLSEGQPEQPPVNTGAAGDESAGPAESEGPGATEIEAPGAVEDSGEAPTSREEYWRRRGWESGPAEGEGPAAVENGQNAPKEGEGLLEGEEGRPID